MRSKFTVCLRNRGIWCAIALLMLSAAMVRMAGLEERPMHADEAVHAVILGDLLEGETYRYRPTDFHGPVLMAFAYPLCRGLRIDSLAQMEAADLRLVPLFASVALVGIAAFFFPRNERLGTLGALFWLGWAAPFVYYGSYFIHEMIFVVLSLLWLLALFRFWGSGSISAGLLAGCTMGLLAATKEAFVIVLGCSVVAWFVAFRKRPQSSHSTRWGWAALIAGFLLITSISYTSFGTRWSGLADFGSGLWRMFARAQGEGHEKSWGTYARWLLWPNVRTLPWSGWVLVGFCGFGVYSAWRRRGEAASGFFLCVYAVATCLVYTFIPYKTPWLALNFLAPMAIIAGRGLEFCYRMGGRNSVFRKCLWGIGLVAVSVAMIRETYWLCFRFETDEANPWAYVPTVPDIRRLQAGLEAAERPEVIRVMSDDYWPLPWFLRRFSDVGYWNEIPDDFEVEEGGVYLVSLEWADALESRLGDRWQGSLYGLRPGVLIVCYRPLAEL